MRNRPTRGFTIVELLVVVSIIALLVGILLPAIGRARDQARLTMSQANLRQLAVAHASYGAEWGDRQLTLIVDNISAYGSNPAEAFGGYQAAGGDHPPIILGWGYSFDQTQYGFWRYPLNGGGFSGNYGLAMPIEFNSNYGGMFRMWNIQQFNQYVSGRFYDPTFYAPKDTAVINAISECLDDPGQWSDRADVREDLGDIPAWSSYCMSAAAGFSPSVFRHSDVFDNTANGFRDPWSIPAGFRSPAFSQALYPNLKTHMLEHHWLQGKNGPECNDGFDEGTYSGCEPWYFNHAVTSSPVTLFYDGHVGSLGVLKAQHADQRMSNQTNQDGWGLWSRDTTAWGDSGYLIDYGYDSGSNTSYHILTTGGIRGRDYTAE